MADLVDLEQELSSIQRGITQMERITPIEPPTKNQNEDDPFGDSFTQYPVRFETKIKTNIYIICFFKRLF